MPSHSETTSLLGQKPRLSRPPRSLDPREEENKNKIRPPLWEPCKGEACRERKEGKHCFHWFTITGLATLATVKGGSFPDRPPPARGRPAGQGPEPPASVCRAQPEPQVVSWCRRNYGLSRSPLIHPRDSVLAMLPRPGRISEFGAAYDRVKEATYHYALGHSSSSTARQQ